MAEDLTEDQVRDKARGILDFEDRPGVVSGVGQLMTFNRVGFKGVWRTSRTGGICPTT